MAITQRLYRPARNTYQRILNRHHFEERQRRRDHFRPFIQPGQLAFDIGAHRGHYAETFMELGAHVVAVEPNPALADTIRRHYPRITVIEKAVGSQAGTAMLTLGHDTEHSTLSNEWAAANEHRWSGTIDVQVTTIDALIADHGQPHFVKIDVEGFETEVLRGLNQPVPVLCFEFQCAALDPEPLRLLHGYQFAVSTEPLELGPWGTATDAWQQMLAFREREPEGSGDVFAKH